MDSQAQLFDSQQDFEYPEQLVYWNLLKPVASAEMKNFREDFFQHDKRQLREHKLETGIWAVRRTGSDLLNTTPSSYDMDFFNKPFDMLRDSKPGKLAEQIYSGLAILSKRNHTYFLLKDYKVKEVDFEDAKNHIESFGKNLWRALMAECREKDPKFYRNNINRW